jgi:hypothetical protein
VSAAISSAYSQNYHAVNGSSFAGSLGVGNNPASIVNTPFAWDVNVFSTQLKYSTNAIKIYNYSLISSPANSEYVIMPGEFARRAIFNFNTNILNARIALNRRKAFAIGANLRGYGQANLNTLNYNDTLETVRDFTKINDNKSLSGKFTSSAWLELFATYSQTIWDGPASRLNAGITVKVMRGISGAHVQAENLRTEKILLPEGQVYQLVNGSATYGYSSNYDQWKKEKSSSQNLRDFFNYSQSGAAIDIGVEYLIKSQSVQSFYDEDDYHDYEWKIGISLLDLGLNRYRHGIESRMAVNPQLNNYDSVLDRKFDGIENVRGFNDTLSTVVTNLNGLSPEFTILNPARLVINVDRNLQENFYINGEVSLNLASLLAGKNKLYVSEMNLIAITPRWEKQSLGFYMPILFNTKNQLWVGGAVKAGPLLFGVHNWGNVFSKKKMQNGGLYLALVIRPKGRIRSSENKGIDCPPGL